MRTAWRKMRALFALYFQDSIAYRATAFIWLLTDTVQCVIMPLVWLAAYNEKTSIGGYQPGQIVMYYLTMAFVTNFVVSHMMWDLAFEIKEGVLSQWLLRPFPIIGTLFARNLSWRMMRTVLFIPMMVLCLLYYRSYVDWNWLHLSGWFVLSVVLGHFVSFFTAFAMANVAFWLQEVQSVFALYYIPMLLLSGWVAPLGLTPAWLQWLAIALPFRYTTAVPVEIALGKLQGDALLMGVLGQVVWIMLGGLLGAILWRKGLRQYAGVGM